MLPAAAQAIPLPALLTSRPSAGIFFNRTGDWLEACLFVGGLLRGGGLPLVLSWPVATVVWAAAPRTIPCPALLVSPARSTAGLKFKPRPFNGRNELRYMKFVICKEDPPPDERQN